ncbi:MAG: hypothetical protein JW827_00670 [Spirochaetes bacterium]|nr:hypothetical protein [Spirochaetota bacterium]
MIFFKSLGRRFRILGKLFQFLWKIRMWWMIPLIVVILLFALIIIFGQSSAIAPFIYTLF